jgi:16S rRNA (uracil1498-N3)-methyltransferase
MKHVFRFFGQIISTQPHVVWEINADENHHLQKVLKLKVGDLVEVQNFDGQWSSGKIASLSKDQTEVVSDTLKKQPPAFTSLRIMLGALKPTDLDDVLPSLVELGVSEIVIFLAGQDSKVRVSEKNQARWQRILVGAAKQCKRAGIPKITCFDSLSESLESLSFNNFTKILLDPFSDKAVSELKPLKGNICFAIGSEAGFNQEELEALRQSGFHGANCGPYILRGFTAAILAASLRH